MKQSEKRLELMAPAGSWEALQAAINSGADSIYFGVDQLNMRAKGSINFTVEDLKEIADRCNAAGVKTYLTLNTIIYDHDLSIIKRIINTVKEVGISSVIAADHAVIQYAFSQGVDVHISTQLNITNVETVKFYAMFANVMVLSRELSLRQIKLIVDEVEKQGITGPNGEIVRIEVFGHGALCMAVSGKCYLSLHTANSSANRGACVQNCRRKYTVKDEDGNELMIDNEYIMSPKDLCTIDFLDQMIDAGVQVLKIEGRGRAPEYVSTVIRAYREAIDSYYDGSYSPEKVEGWMVQLHKVYNRGFWGGYLLGQKLGEWTEGHGSQATQKKVFLGKVDHYYTKAGVGQVRMEAQSVKIGDKILITGPTTGVVEMELETIKVDDKDVDKAVKGDLFTFPITEKLRPSDKFYKLVESK